MKRLCLLCERLDKRWVKVLDRHQALRWEEKKKFCMFLSVWLMCEVSRFRPPFSSVAVLPPTKHDARRKCRNIQQLATGCGTFGGGGLVGQLKWQMRVFSLTDNCCIFIYYWWQCIYIVSKLACGREVILEENRAEKNIASGLLTCLFSQDLKGFFLDNATNTTMATNINSYFCCYQQEFHEAGH